MSKKKILLATSIILILAVSLLIVPKSLTYYYINQLNENLSASEFKLLAKAADLKKPIENFTQEPGFGCIAYTNDNDGIRILFSSFPDVTTHGYSLTGIELRNSSYSLYGIHVGDSIDNVTDILLKHGYRILDNEVKRPISFKKDKILINFQFNEKNAITKIYINLQSTNKKKVVF